MKRIVACCLILITTAHAPGLCAQARADSATIARIRAEGLDHSHVLETFNMLTNIIGPRLTGSPAFRQAADWTRGQLASWGAGNAHLEPWEFGRGWTLEKLTLELTSPRYFPLIGYPEAWTPSTHGVIEGEPIYVGDRTAEEITALSAKLRGAIVLALPPQTRFITEDRLQPSSSDARVPIGQPRNPPNNPKTPLREMTALLQQAGAAVVLRPNAGQHGTLFVLGNRATPDDAVPAIIVASEHYNMLVRLAQSDRPPRVRVELGTRYHEQDRNAYNVIAEIPGTDPALKDEVVMLGAHLDSWHSATGATDNADDAAELMEALRILKATGVQPRRTIRFALWGGEEEGLLGSKAWVHQHLEGPANRAARDHLYLYLNSDPGTGPIYGYYLEENTAIKPIFDAWLAPLRDLGMRRNVLDHIGATDHLSFIAAGVPGFNTIKDYTDYDTRTHHTNTDFYERVRPEDLVQSSIVMAVIAWEAATRQGPLPKPVS